MSGGSWVATAVSVADALTTKVLRLTAEGGELRAAAAQHRETVQELRSRLSAAEISAEQSKQASRDAQSKPYQHRCNVRKRKHGAGEEDWEARYELGSETGEGGDNNDSDEEPRRRIRRNRPKGLRYKLRRAAPVSKDNIDAYTRRRRDKLEQCLTTMFGAKWEEYYRNDGTGETLSALPSHAGDRSGEAAAGDIGDTACNRSPADKERRSYKHMSR
eukprot:jgi/Tetstr1/462820/TSEL_007770.t1